MSDHAALTEAEETIAEAIVDRVTWGDGTEYINVKDAARLLAEAVEQERAKWDHTSCVEAYSALVAKVEALHPRFDNPTHGCCAPPKLCSGHGAVCNGREHGLNKPSWPCPTIRALTPADTSALDDVKAKAGRAALLEAADEWEQEDTDSVGDWLRALADRLGDTSERGDS